jgi:hypothetical protein
MPLGYDLVRLLSLTFRYVGYSGEEVIVSRELKPVSFELTMSSFSQAQHLGGQHRSALYLSGSAISP